MLLAAVGGGCEGRDAAPEARYWVSQRHRVVSRVQVSEPGISIMYARD